MGQKINPISNRLGLQFDWQSKWFAGTQYKEYAVTDMKIRDFIKEKLDNAGIRRVEIIRSRDRLMIRINTSKPGLVIGRGGKGISGLQEEIQKKYYPTKTPIVRVEILEERNPDTSAELVAQGIGSQISRRIAYRRAAKQAIDRAMSNKQVLGIKVIVSGRLNGAEIARKEKFQVGSIPLSRFEYDIDFAVNHAKTTYGIIGIKVWINRGKQQEKSEDSED